MKKVTVPKGEIEILVLSGNATSAKAEESGLQLSTLGYRVSKTGEAFHLVYAHHPESTKPSEYVKVSENCVLSSPPEEDVEHVNMNLFINRKTKEFALRDDLTPGTHYLEAEKMSPSRLKDYVPNCKIDLSRFI
jgi:hypothetical protein